MNKNETPTSTVLDRQKIATPVVFCTPLALSQLQLMMENDFTLKGRFLRIVISGKGCDGFTYSVGFTDLADDDYEIEIGAPSSPMIILMDPFTAFYLQECSLDFVQNLDLETEGFVITNHAQEKYSGKFWKEDQSKVPPTSIQ